MEQKRKVEERQKKINYMRASKVDEVAKKHSRRVSEKAPRRDEVAVNTKNPDNTIEAS